MTLSFRRLRAAALFAAATTTVPASADPVAASQDDLAAFAPVLAELPPGERPLATLYALGPDGRSLLRRGSGVFICLGDAPGDDSFSATCYHRALDPYNALGERLTAEGLSGESWSARLEEELDAGRIAMPFGAYEVSVSGPLDPKTGRPGELTVYHLVYTPGATPAEVGLPDHRDDAGPYLHHAGRRDAHVMWSEVRPPG